MALVVDCPSCTRKLRLPPDLLGRMVKCANCGGTFEAKETPAAPSAPSAPVADAAGSPARPSKRSRPRRDEFDFEEEERCPRCGAEVRAGAARCFQCGEELGEEVDDRPWERGVRRDCEPHRGGLVLTLGIVGIVCGAVSVPFFFCYGLGAVIALAGLGLSIPAWVMGHRDLAKMREGVKDPRGQGTTQGGWICGIIGTCLNIIMMLVSVAMLVIIIVFIVMAASTANTGGGAVPAQSQQQQPMKQPPNNPRP